MALKAMHYILIVNTDPKSAFEEGGEGKYDPAMEPELEPEPKKPFKD